MAETRFEDEVREALRAEAQSEPFRISSVVPAASRARKRLLRNEIVAGALGLAVVIALLSGLRLVQTDISIPVTTPTPPLPHGDGKIAFVSRDRHDVLSVEPDGSGMAQLTDCGIAACGSITGLVWSPDGSTMLFARWADKFDPVGNLEGALYTVDADGSNLQKLTDCQAPTCQDAGAAWSPDGTKIVFYRHGSAPGVYVIAADGSGLTLVSSDPSASVVSWSPDGTKVAYDDGGAGTIHTAEVDGSGVKPLVSGAGSPGPSKPAWSPDGTRIAYVSDETINGRPEGRLWVIGADGTDRRLLYSGGHFDPGLPVWSPSGQKIAFSVAMNARSTTMLVIDVNGSHVRRLQGSVFPPVWSPSGESIAEWVGGKLVVVSPEGKRPRVVARELGLGGIAWQPV